ncbi:hypothetical protein FQR65_LT05703 [Abscondita terminalis]|nr:hypothetical protein FQR65_LT05703 [Abscondita terminalis]
MGNIAWGYLNYISQSYCILFIQLNFLDTFFCTTKLGRPTKNEAPFRCTRCVASQSGKIISPPPTSYENLNKTKRLRTTFHDKQLNALKAFFVYNKKPDADQLLKLSQSIGLPVRVLQVWFQNARAKWKRITRTDGVPSQEEQMKTSTVPLLPFSQLGHHSFPNAAFSNITGTFQNDTIKLLLGLQNDMTDVKSLLVRVLDHAGSSGTFSALTVFPLKTIEEMDKAEDQLRSEEFFEKYANVISRLGGSSEAKIVNNICSYVFHHALAQQIRLTASSGKRAIDNTKLLALICGGIILQSLVPLEGDFACARCTKRYKYKKSLVRHCMTGIETYVCTCGKEYKYKKTLIRHQRYECHRERLFGCPHCSYRAFQKGTLKCHVAKIHHLLIGKNWESYSKTSYPCGQCTKKYGSKTALNRHLKYDCGKEPMFRCLQCPYRAHQKIHVQKHYINVHFKKCDKSQVCKSEDKLECQVCNRKYKNITTLRAHIALDCGKERKFLCVQSTSNHFQCSVCGRNYKYKQSLQLHIKNECGKEPKFFCTVPDCGYKRLSYENIKRDGNIMNGYKFACPTCQKFYVHKKTLSRHIRQECGKEPDLLCPMCPYRARRLYVLKSHMKTHTHVFN